MQPTGFRATNRMTGGSEGGNGYGTMPLLPTPPVQARPVSKEGMSAWDRDRGVSTGELNEMVGGSPTNHNL